jgi:hypothetical protein
MARRMVSQKQEGAKKSSGSRNRRGLVVPHYFLFCSFCLTHSLLFRSIYIVKLNLLKGFTRTITQCNGFRALGWIAFVAAVDATGRQLRQWKASQSKSFEGVNMLSFSNIHFFALLIMIRTITTSEAKPTGNFQAKRPINLNFVH